MTEEAFLFSCPICGKSLKEEKGRCICGSGHSFDRARSGYVNLLLSGGKHSKVPGDNKLMVMARREFLEKGFYRPLADKFADEAASELESVPSPGILDAGCGEGYYTRILFDRLNASGLSPRILGVDISKFASEKAARRFSPEETVRIAAASVFHLPVKSESCDAVVTLFAPMCREEYLRVLKPGGLFIMVIPGRRHLFGLKAAIYDKPYLNEIGDYAIDGLSFYRSVSVDDEIELKGEEILSLFKMTPYYYKTSAEGQARAAGLSALTTETSFEILVYRKDKIRSGDNNCDIA